MGTTLTGTTPQDTYDSLIKVTDNGPLSGTAKYLSDGLGNDSVLALSTSKVLIGNTGVSAINETLNVTGAGIAIEQTDGGVTTMLGAFGSADTILGAFTNNDVVMRTNNIERMRITSAGNVGIGTSSPAAKLDVYANATNSSINVNHAVNSGTIPQYAGISFGATSTNFGGDTRYTGGAGVQSVNTAESGNETDLRFWTTTGGSPSEKVRILAGGGLTFNGDTAAANALDDYEEGTWTMGVQFGGASVGVTYGANTGTYTKIGQQVTVNGVLVITNKGTSTGIAQISGLPFTVKSSVSNYSAPSFRFENVANTGTLQGYGNVGTTFVPLEQINTAGVAGAVFDTDFSNNSSILISFTYFV